MNFYVTFGQKWRRFRHPRSVKGMYPHPDGWVRIFIDEKNPTIAGLHHSERDGAAYDLAFWMAKNAFGDEFSGLYSWESLEESFYPLGELAVIGEQVAA